MSASRRQAAAAGLTPDEVRAHLKERIYGAFACLTTLLLLTRHPGHGTTTDAWTAAFDVALALLGLWAASLVAEVLAHLASHGAGLSRRDWAQMAGATWQIVSAGVVPIFLLVLAAVGLVEFSLALGMGVAAVIVSLGLFVYLAVRRTPIPTWQRVLLMVLLMGVAALVVLLKAIAH
ncbi:hypothetical protein ACLM5J_20760 [Nocardioides sp. Bht2]|uniref:hypothetical protein n=1 Tax=Nocardioides sp. Bht2 TaxID=3392297 RepID=UPI0039B5E55F